MPLPKRLLAVFGSSAVCLFASPAAADICGDEYEIDVESFEVAFAPDIDCVTAVVTGSNQPGCDQLELQLTNECEVELEIVDPTSGVRCFVDERGDIRDDCVSFAPGETAAIHLPPTAEGEYDFTFALRRGAEDVDVDVTIQAIDRAAGCSVAEPGMSSASGALAAIAALAGALVSRKRAHRRRCTIE